MTTVNTLVLSRHTFGISYFSEVTTAIEIRKECRTYESGFEMKFIVAEAVFPMENVGMACWFHFHDSKKADEGVAEFEILQDQYPDTIEVKSEVLESERATVFTVLGKMANKLFPGVVPVMKNNRNIGTKDEMFRTFWNEILFAFITGEHLGADVKVPQKLWLDKKLDSVTRQTK